ncbi:restriction endonuclease subunit S [Paenibacillus sp. GCM10012307]|uniref:Restriction endonuclease subunit S n=1 Tax=Paenibacillus roseus TaxID=2798579 RepID=A0A934JB54_9BACL|nr:restriction endonuclease subunit S [Paenibacillus roseus]MBJ6363817.1 restriction endonuclease subunit S [Paenibacillus roseus]
MSREQSFMRVLDASAKLQWNVAMILEAKAVESEKVRNWLCNHMTSQAFTSQQEQLKGSMDVHDQLIEVIEGLTKLGQGMSSVLKVVLQQDSESGGDGVDGMFGSGGFDTGFGDKG